MSKGCRPNKPCGMQQGIFNPFFGDWFPGSLLGSGGYGLLTSLLNQSGNGGTTMKFRSVYNGNKSAGPGLAFKGTYSAATNYVTGDMVTLNGTYIVYRALQANGPATSVQTPNPYQSSAYWGLEPGISVLQDIGNGKYVEYQLGIQSDESLRWSGIAVCTLSASSGSFFLQSGNFTTGTAVGTSSTSNTVSAVNSSKTYVIPTGLSNVFDKVNLGSSSSSIAIMVGNVTPVFTTITLQTGLSLSSGDAIKLENSASNWNVARVITYNSSTGSTYVAIINGVGSGTYTSWTVYRCQLLWFYRTSAQSSYMHGVVDTYNSGTGSVSVTTFTTNGSGTFSDWTVVLGKYAPVITTSQGSQIAQYSHGRGTCIMGKYYGTRLIHRSQKTQFSMAFKYIILTGPAAGSEYTVDTYNASSLPLTTQTLVAEDLPFAGESGYDWMAITIDSPTNPVGANNIDAQINYSTNVSNQLGYRHEVDIDEITYTNPIAGGGQSSGEMAWNFRKSGTSDGYEWIPDHGQYQKCIGRNRTLVVNGTTTVNTDLQTANPYAFRYQDITSVELTQVLEIFHSQQVSKMADMTTIHRFDRQGMYYKQTITTTQSWEIATGYTHMIVFGESGGLRWWDKFLTDDGVTYTWPGGSTPQNLAANQVDWQSALFYSLNNSYTNNQNYVLAFYAYDPTYWRTGLAQSGTSLIGFSGGPKLYPYAYNGYTMPSGTTTIVEGRLYCGNKGSLVLN